MNSSMRVCNIFGVPVHLHWSILFAAGGLVYSQGVFSGITLFLMVFFSVLAHEYAHVLVARHYDLSTSRITLHYFGGTASIDELRGLRPSQEAAIAIAGPALNAVFAILALAIGALLGHLVILGPLVLGTTLPKIFGAINLIIGFFNMLPIFPLDGGRVIYALLQTRFSETKSKNLVTTISLVFSSALLLLAIFKLNSMLPIAILIFAITAILKHQDYGDSGRMI